MLNLRMNGDNLAGKFSGGNKRKLMVACSLIGNPKAILLDEPSSGMDPEAKRFMWNSIKKFKKDSGVILTTHSMDEAEALADQIAIMKHGEFKFTGTLSQLRNQYSNGLYVDLMLKISSEDLSKFVTETGLKEDNLDIAKVKMMIEDSFHGQLAWDDLIKFGNGRMIHEQLVDAEGNDLEATVDAALVIEFIIVIQSISRIMIKLKGQYKDIKIEMENIGQFLRFNIQASDLNCGNLFSILDSNHENLMIN